MELEVNLIDEIIFDKGVIKSKTPFEVHNNGKQLILTQLSDGNTIINSSIKIKGDRIINMGNSGLIVTDGKVMKDGLEIVIENNEIHIKGNPDKVFVNDESIPIKPQGLKLNKNSKVQENIDNSKKEYKLPSDTKFTSITNKGIGNIIIFDDKQILCPNNTKITNRGIGNIFIRTNDLNVSNLELTVRDNGNISIHSNRFKNKALEATSRGIGKIEIIGMESEKSVLTSRDIGNIIITNANIINVEATSRGMGNIEFYSSKLANKKFKEKGMGSIKEK